MKNLFMKLMTAFLAFTMIAGILAPAAKAQAAVYGEKMSEAVEIKLGKRIESNLNKFGPDEHWYKFTTPKEDVYYTDLLLDKSVLEHGIIIEIKDSFGERVGSVSLSDPREQFRLKPDSVYYVRAYWSSGLSESNPYAFIIDTVDDPETDSMADADIKIISGIAYNGSIAAYYEDDWMYFISGADETTVTVSRKDDGWNIWPTVYDENGKKVTSISTLGFNGSKTFETEKDAKYYINISGNPELGEEKDMGYKVLVDSGKVDIADCDITVKDIAYTGSARKATVTVKINGTKLVKNTDYTLKYSNNTEIGKAKVTITGKGKFTGKVTKSFKVIPAKPEIFDICEDDDNYTIEWEGVEGVTGYEIYYSSKKSSGYKKLKAVSGSKTEYTTDKLTSGKYVKIRAYKTVGDTKYYSSYSAVYKVE